MDFRKGDVVKFLGYQKPPVRGNPPLTIAKTYIVERDGPTPNWRYVYIRNDRNTVYAYPAKNFELVAAAGSPP